MKWIIQPSRLAGSIAIPASKSHTIRALLIATLASGTSQIHKPLITGDGASALNAARSLGATVALTADLLTITGRGTNFEKGSDFFAMGNSGTSTNLFTSAIALGKRTRSIDGDASLRSRPFKPLLNALEQMGATISFKQPDQGDLPFSICGPLQGSSVTVDGVSSQFVSSLLLIAPLLTGADTNISVVNIHEIPYIELTLWWLKKQGIGVEHAADYSHFHIPSGQNYHAFETAIPADFSSATFAAVGAALGGNAVTLQGLDFSDPQGDKEIFTLLAAAGASVHYEPDHVTVSRNQALTIRTIDLNRMPDALPAVAVLACAAEGETAIVNVKNARIKETDRIAVMYSELKKMGADITETDEGLTIRQSKLTGTTVYGHDDHRVVMALALAAGNAHGTTTITTAEAASVTYPTFVEDFKALGATIKIVEE